MDPGATTGIVCLSGEGGIQASLHLPGRMVGDWLGLYLSGHEVSVVAVERFFISPRTLRGTREGSLEALYTIGVVRYICEQARVPMRLQTAATAKNAYSDERLKKLGLYSKVSGPHERDALRHALLAARGEETE